MYTDINSVNPFLRLAMPSIMPKGHTLNRRVIFDYELLYVEKGEFTLVYGDIPYPCRQGQFLLLRPGVPHSFEGINTELSQPHIHFDMVFRPQSPKIPISFKDIPDLTPEEVRLIHPDILEGYPLTPYVEFNDKDLCMELFYTLVNSAPPYGLLPKAYLTRLIHHLTADNFPDCFKRGESGPDIARQIKDFIDAGQGLLSTLEDLEKRFSYSRYHLERQFNRAFGISLIAYRNKKRLALAAELLKNDSVSSVSSRLGFSSIYVFSRAFKGCYGLSPSAYKAEYSNILR